jgi:hypothetical protein
MILAMFKQCSQLDTVLLCSGLSIEAGYRRYIAVYFTTDRRL